MLASEIYAKLPPPTSAMDWSREEPIALPKPNVWIGAGRLYKRSCGT